jgi:hypothetical protein
MVELTGKWSIKASFGQVPARRRIPHRLHIKGSVAHDGFHSLREGTTLRPVAGSACTVTPQWFEAKSGTWHNANEISEMGFEAGEGIVIDSYSNPASLGPAAPIAPSVGANTLSLRCTPLDRILKTPRSKGEPSTLAIPLYFMESVPVCCPPKDGGSRKINVGTGHARWVDGTNALASLVIPNGAWAVRPNARWIKYAVDPPLPSSDEDNIVEPEYFYALKLFVPSNCGVPINVQLSGLAYGDNDVVITLDGVELGKTPTGTAYGFRDPNGVPFSAVIAPGHHVLAAKVHNISGPTGLLVEATLTVS